MLFCKNCGAQLKDGTKFCNQCGTSIEVPGVETQQQGTEIKNSEFNEKFNAFVGKVKEDKKKLAACIAIPVLLLAVIIGVIVVNQSRPTLDLSDYAQVEYSGFDTDAYASMDFDMDSFAKDLKEKLVEKRVLESDASDAEAAVIAEKIFYDCLYYIDQEEGLSNGDKIQISWNMQSADLESYLKELKIQIVGTDKSIKVSGLEEVKTIDPFDCISVTFDGVAPYISVKYENTSEEKYLSSLFFEVTSGNSDELNVGDTVTLKVATDEETALYYGYKFETMTKDYTVESADTYAASASAIGDANLETMKSQAVALLQENIVATADYTVSEFTYAGYYFLNKKETSEWDTHNDLCLVYTAVLSPAGGNTFDPMTVYLPVNFADVVVKADGTAAASKEIGTYSISGGIGFVGDSWSYLIYGYETEEKMYSSIIDYNKEEYSYEISEGLQEFGN